jgi:hypothetical protein
MSVYHHNNNNNNSRILTDMDNRTDHAEDNNNEEEDAAFMLAVNFEDVVLLLEEVELEETADDVMWDNTWKVVVVGLELDLHNFHSPSQEHEVVDEMEEHHLAVVEEEEGHSMLEVDITRGEDALDFIPMTNTSRGMSLQRPVVDSRRTITVTATSITTATAAPPPTTTTLIRQMPIQAPFDRWCRQMNSSTTTSQDTRKTAPTFPMCKLIGI